MSISEALASVLYPKKVDDSLLYQTGKGVGSIDLPLMGNAWQSFLANTLQGVVGTGLKGYATQQVNEANSENAAQMIPYLKPYGIDVSPDLAEGLTSTDKKKRDLALALIDRQMTQADKQAAGEAEFNMFKKKEDYKATLEDPKKATERESQKNSLENQYRQNVEGAEFQNFQTTRRLLTASISEAMKDDGNADLSLAVNAAKLRDPSSAAMSGEVKANEDAQGFLNQISGTWKRELQQKGKFSPETRAAFLSTIKNYFDSARDIYASKADPMWKLAERKGLDPQNVVMVPYRAEDYANLVGSIPTAESIRKAFAEQEKARQLAAIQPRSPEIGSFATPRPELLPTAPPPVAGPNEEIVQIDGRYIRILKGR